MSDAVNEREEPAPATHERLRVPMKQEPAMFTKGDVAAAIQKTKIGVRFSLDVTEEALANMGREVMPFVVQKLAEGTIHRERHVIQAAVHELLYTKREWLEKIVEDETRQMVRSFMTDTMSGWVERMEANTAMMRELALRYAHNDSEEVS